MDYFIEAERETLKGVVICGSNAGYEEIKQFSLEKLLSSLQEANHAISALGLNTIPCIVQEAALIGRSTNTPYRESVYLLNFSWSPRMPELDKAEFYKSLLQYASLIGRKLEQERVYIEFDGKTIILRTEDEAEQDSNLS